MSAIYLAIWFPFFCLLLYVGRTMVQPALELPATSPFMRALLEVTYHFAAYLFIFVGAVLLFLAVWDFYAWVAA